MSGPIEITDYGADLEAAALSANVAGGALVFMDAANTDLLSVALHATAPLVDSGTALEYTYVRDSGVFTEAVFTPSATGTPAKFEVRRSVANGETVVWKGAVGVVDSGNPFEFPVMNWESGIALPTTMFSAEPVFRKTNP